jgi:glyoxylase-like metal-dependent hydrolase (beta-lactamase superfamily II)
VPFDLGGRVLEVTGSPGHHPAAITVYDPWTGFLLTGDSVLPGRLYAFDFPQFKASIDRMVSFAGGRSVTHVLGCHIEMTAAPRRDYPLGATYQPRERALPMTVDQLRDVQAAAASAAGRQGVHRFDDFIIYNQPGRRDRLTLMARGLLHKAGARVLRR